MGGHTALAQGILAFYRAHELLGLFLFLLVEETGVPLVFPGDVLILAAGARAGRSGAGAALVVLVAAGAAALGSSALYTLVRAGGRPLLARYGRFVHLEERRLATAERWFRRHGALAIVLGRLVPGLRTPTTIMAGLFDVPYRTFAPATSLAALLWALLYFVLGLTLRRGWRAFVGTATGRIEAATGVVIVLATLVALIGALARRRRPPDEEQIAPAGK